MISLSHLLSIRARPVLPLSQEQGNTDTETVAATRFAALHFSLFKTILENQSWQPILLPNNPKKNRFFCHFSLIARIWLRASASQPTVLQAPSVRGFAHDGCVLANYNGRGAVGNLPVNWVARSEARRAW